MYLKLILLWIALASLDCAAQIESLSIEEIELLDDVNVEEYELLKAQDKFPIDLNIANLKELLAIPHFNFDKAMSFIKHRKENGRLLSLFELQVIPSFSTEFIKEIIPYVYVGNKRFDKELLKVRKSELLVFGSDRYRARENESIKDFHGPSFSSMVKITKSWGRKLSLGVVLEKDYYENVFPIDNVVGGIELKDIAGLKRLCLGNFVASFGSGLVYGSGFGGFKSFDLLSSLNSFSGVKKVFSAREYGKFNGVGFVIGKSRFELSVLASKTMEDVWLKESSDGPSFSYIVKSGLHRSQREKESKDALVKKDFALSISRQFGNLSIGFIGSKTTYSHRRELDNALKYIHRLNFRSQVHGSIYYNLYVRNILLKGEFALSSGNKIALINKCIKSLSKRSSLLLIYRNYLPGYESFNSKAFGEWQGVENESGLYFGLNSKWRKSSLSLYLDFYKSPWFRAGGFSVIRGKEVAIRYLVNLNKKELFYVSFKSENKADFTRNVNFYALNEQNVVRARVHSEIVMTKELFWINRIEICKVNKQFGVINFQDIRFKFKEKFKVGAKWTYYSLNNYDLRTFSFEQNVFGRGGLVGVWGSGIRRSYYVRYRSKYLGVIECKLYRFASYTISDSIFSANNGRGLAIQWRYLF